MQSSVSCSLGHLRFAGNCTVSRRGFLLEWLQALVGSSSSEPGLDVVILLHRLRVFIFPCPPFSSVVP